MLNKEPTHKDHKSSRKMENTGLEADSIMGGWMAW